MGRLEWTVIGLLCLWILPNQVWGQNDRSYVKFNYERQNNFTFAANLDTRYAFTKARYSFDLRLIHTNIYNTSLASKRFVQLYLSSSLKQHYRLTKRLDLASWLETDQYLNNRNQKINLYAGVRYRPYSFLTVTPLLGYAWDERTAVLGQSQAKAQLDQGFTPAIFLESYKEFKDGLSTQTTMFARYKIIQPRRQHDFSLDHSWSKKFKEGVNLNTGARLASHEIDDYQANSVKRIISDSVLSRLGIEYEISPGLSWRSENNLLLFRRFFKFENQVSEIPEENNLTFAGLEIFTSQRVSLVRKKWKAYGNYEFLYSSRQYDLENNVGLNEVTFAGTLLNEKQKDFFKAQHKVDLLFNASLSKRQSFTFQLTNQYLQYDTPSEMNFGDRDELSYLANANWMVRWRRNFFTAFNLSGNYRHYAFLFK
ncbi:MAG TPA: hypothetical protein ENJ82_12450, partial [Bacteroidetes bacterium]|nr:hypothetical protein [Bacteroidota bacterium]